MFDSEISPSPAVCWCSISSKKNWVGFGKSIALGRMTMTGDRGLATGDFQECSILFFIIQRGSKASRGKAMSNSKHSKKAEARQNSNMIIENLWLRLRWQIGQLIKWAEKFLSFFIASDNHKGHLKLPRMFRIGTCSVYTDQQRWELNEVKSMLSNPNTPFFSAFKKLFSSVNNNREFVAAVIMAN